MKSGQDSFSQQLMNCSYTYCKNVFVFVCIEIFNTQLASEEFPPRPPCHPWSVGLSPYKHHLLVNNENGSTQLHSDPKSTLPVDRQIF